MAVQSVQLLNIKFCPEQLHARRLRLLFQLPLLSEFIFQLLHGHGVSLHTHLPFYWGCSPYIWLRVSKCIVACMWLGPPPPNSGNGLWLQKLCTVEGSMLPCKSASQNLITKYLLCITTNWDPARFPTPGSHVYLSDYPFSLAHIDYSSPLSHTPILLLSSDVMF